MRPGLRRALLQHEAHLCYTLRFGRELFLDRQSNCSPPIHRSFGIRCRFVQCVNGQNRSMMLVNWVSFLISQSGRPPNKFKGASKKKVGFLVLKGGKCSGRVTSNSSQSTRQCKPISATAQPFTAPNPYPNTGFRSKSLKIRRIPFPRHRL